MPLKMIDNARGSKAGGTRRMATAAAMLQKPPSATPSKIRIASSTARLEDIATNRLEATIRVLKASSTARRSSARVRPGTSSPANNATTAVTVTACPASASETPRSSAIGVSRLAGRYSAVSKPNTPIASENTAIQAGGASAARDMRPSQTASQTP
ncbi:Uncharacterised protein [Achromobacter dolens]|nr:Uncharacterised protein [Achromobacter dolens]